MKTLILSSSGQSGHNSNSLESNAGTATSDLSSTYRNIKGKLKRDMS